VIAGVAVLGEHGGVAAVAGRMKVCLNGGRGRDDHPAVPLSPAELAASAAAAVGRMAAGLPRFARPGFASVNIGEPGSADLPGLLQSLGIAAEAGVWSVADAALLAAAEPTAGWLRILVEILDAPPATAPVTASEILHHLGTLGVAAPVLLHGEGQSCWPLIAHAGALGLPTRIGLEDTTCGPDGSPVSGNAELIRLALQTWAASAAP
jgi:uncharacterized protein (DUF849 family)